MTVRISKPAFNLRDKLTELDFARVPYEKMPPQSIIQRKRYFNTSNKSTSSSNDTDIITGQIRPIFSSSQILIELAVTPYGGNSDTLSARGRIRRGYGVGTASSGTQIMYNRRMFFRSGSALKQCVVKWLQWMNHIQLTFLNMFFRLVLSQLLLDHRLNFMQMVML